VAGSEKERDWDKEMAEVDRLLKKLPNADPTLGRGAGYEPTAKKPSLSTVTPRGGVAPPSGSGRLGTWAKVALGVLVAVGVAPGVWPYTHGCGLHLIFYLAGVTTVIAAGLGAVVQPFILEAAPRCGACHLAGADHLGYPSAYARSAAPRRRQRLGRVALPRRTSAHAGTEALISDP